MNIFGSLILATLLARSSELLPAGTTAPPIQALGADGRAWGQDFEGHITVVDFFATWCPHCRRSLADYDRLLATFGDRVRVVIVDAEEDPRIVRAFFGRRRTRGMEVVIDSSGRTSRAWSVHGFPTMYVVDRHGVIREAWSGWDDDSYRELSQLIPTLEKEDAPRELRGRRGARRGGRAVERTKPAAFTGDERARQLGVEVLH